MIDSFTFDLLMTALKRILEKLDLIDISVEKHEIFLSRIQELMTKEPEY